MGSIKKAKSNYIKTKHLIENILNRYGIWILIGLFFCIFASHSLLRHFSFNTTAWDLGIYDQQTWLYSRFVYPYNTIRGIFLLSDHFGLSLMLFVPFYWIYSHAETILVLQALLVALSAFPLWAIAKHYSKSLLFSYVITFLYLSSVGIQAGIDFDFHLITIAVFFVSYFIYFYWKEKYLWAIIFALLAILTKEDVPIYIAGIAMFLVAFVPLENKKNVKRNKKGRMVALLILVFSAISAFVILRYIMPHLPSQNRADYFSFYSWGNSYPEVIKNIILHPIWVFQHYKENPVMVNAAHIYFTGFGFLPILAPHALLASFPFLMEKFLTDRSVQWSTNYQYGVVGMLELAFASVVTINYLKYFQDSTRQKITFIISILILIIGLNINTKGENFLLRPVFIKQTWVEYRKYQNINRLIALIPKESSVATQGEIIPHISNRKEAYFYLCFSCSNPSRDPDYILLDERMVAPFSLPPDWNVKSEIKSLLDNGVIQSKKDSSHYDLVKQDQNAYLFKKKN